MTMLLLLNISREHLAVAAMRWINLNFSSCYFLAELQIVYQALNDYKMFVIFLSSFVLVVCFYKQSTQIKKVFINVYR